MPTITYEHKMKVLTGLIDCWRDIEKAIELGMDDDDVVATLKAIQADITQPTGN
jgi:hypothetical protein